jgi:hypothetical protein
VFHGLLVAALAGRLSRAVPLLEASPGAIAAHAPLLLLAVLVPLGLLAAIVAVVAVGASRIPPVVAALRAPRLAVLGRVAVAGLVLLPGFVSALVDIVGRRGRQPVRTQHRPQHHQRRDRLPVLTPAPGWWENKAPTTRAACSSSRALLPMVLPAPL